MNNNGAIDFDKEFKLTGLLQDGEEIFSIKEFTIKHKKTLIGAGVGGMLTGALVSVVPTWFKASSQMDKVLISKAKNLFDLPSGLTNLSNLCGIPINGHFAVLGLLSFGLCSALVVKMNNDEEFKQKMNDLKVPNVITISGGLAILLILL